MKNVCPVKNFKKIDFVFAAYQNLTFLKEFRALCPCHKCEIANKEP